ncbi:MAG: tRNA pseudouridine(13) synthase TruD [Candidatus Woesearchaeota archaeon]
MARIKQSPQDFIVKEIPLKTQHSSGPYAHCILHKKNYTTERAVSHLARHLHIPRKKIAYAGTKDKYAQTSQYITIKDVSKEKILDIDLKDIEVEYLSHVSKPLHLGDLQANTFSIVIRELEHKEDFFLPATTDFFVANYFDEQRFSNNNVEVGLAFIHKQYDKAVALLQQDNDYEKLLTPYLKLHTNDYVGALRQLPKKTLLFFIHAVQSKWFNQELAFELKKCAKKQHKEEHIRQSSYSQGEFVFSNDIELFNCLPKKINLVGFLTTLTEFEQEVLGQEHIALQDLLNRQFQFLSVEGDKRSTHFLVKNFTTTPLTKEEGASSYSCTVTFTLPKGCYATMVVRQLVSSLHMN